MPQKTLTTEEHVKNNLPDVLTRWQVRDQMELERPRTAQSFFVPKVDITAFGYDLNLTRYKEFVHEDVQHRPPREILDNLANLETEIQQGIRELEEMLR